MMRASYDVFVSPLFVCVVDLDIGRSVTNDIENVLADLSAELSDGKRFIYRDTTGHWDEVKFEMIDGKPRFKEFCRFDDTFGVIR